MSSIDISASGLSAQRLRLDLIASNLANAETTRTSAGGPYKRLQAVFEANDEDGGVRTADVVQDDRAPRLEYMPGHPDANAQGYVSMPNVNTVEEMVDMISATRSYEANVTALNASKAMTKKALEIGRG
ncbi:MAG TPA: flagellar basal body rod protein FlgC [Armatimonadota bacterium]|jgi:flagellar basal-body rod protein FlgC|nr:flagellar basal body rod protein FlgC [Armatimonadota bacterium]